MANTRTALIAFAAGRIAFGVGLVAAPGKVAGGWLGQDAERGPTQIAIRGLGARDIALSAGMLLTLDDPDRLAPWLAVTIGSDLTDMAATLAAPVDALPSNAKWGTAALAGAAAAAGAVLLAAAKR
ncbi:MAG TPA: hypothetical protein VEX39_14755 [Thermoleophilaceae bacterium]|nr:hypothetical protein [Thermoleophilaceae bacterium]